MVTRLLAGLVSLLLMAGCATAAAQTETEQAFIRAVSGQGYRDGALEAGYRVCALLDNGMSHEGIERFVTDTFRDTRDHAGYYATLFAQYATYNLCPRNLHKYGPI